MSLRLLVRREGWVEAASQQCSDLDLASLVDVYNDGLRRVLDRYAPSVTRCVRDREYSFSAPLDDRGDQRDSTETETGGTTVETRLTVRGEIYAKERAAVKACV